MREGGEKGKEMRQPAGSSPLPEGKIEEKRDQTEGEPVQMD